ncbi:hypothetical protein J8273_0956 [Carpediemonas membranifera]|uniref:Uncharacterized protein n=1 Tax=Carpediemonas membranifera TaxID=201153 RepID=A0A8J6B1U6_9EUKA|nr:hypothetical protein J8273_0956 [Carpediemonas membranifera]|eukprot:KAG9397460.1 hypothetical protein J8273_0956 [Carpediemonas membranifera]
MAPIDAVMLGAGGKPPYLAILSDGSEAIMAILNSAGGVEHKLYTAPIGMLKNVRMVVRNDPAGHAYVLWYTPFSLSLCRFNVGHTSPSVNATEAVGDVLSPIAHADFHFVPGTSTSGEALGFPRIMVVGTDSVAHVLSMEGDTKHCKLVARDASTNRFESARGIEARYCAVLPGAPNQAEVYLIDYGTLAGWTLRGKQHQTGHHPLLGFRGAGNLSHHIYPIRSTFADVILIGPCRTSDTTACLVKLFKRENTQHPVGEANFYTTKSSLDFVVKTGSVRPNVSALDLASGGLIICVWLADHALVYLTDEVGRKLFYNPICVDAKTDERLFDLRITQDSVTILFKKAASIHQATFRIEDLRSKHKDSVSLVHIKLFDVLPHISGPRKSLPVPPEKRPPVARPEAPTLRGPTELRAEAIAVRETAQVIRQQSYCRRDGRFNAPTELLPIKPEEFTVMGPSAVAYKVPSPKDVVEGDTRPVYERHSMRVAVPVKDKATGRVSVMCGDIRRLAEHPSGLYVTAAMQVFAPMNDITECSFTDVEVHFKTQPSDLRVRTLIVLAFSENPTRTTIMAFRDRGKDMTPRQKGGMDPIAPGFTDSVSGRLTFVPSSAQAAFFLSSTGQAYSLVLGAEPQLSEGVPLAKAIPLQAPIIQQHAFSTSVFGNGRLLIGAVKNLLPSFSAIFPSYQPFAPVTRSDWISLSVSSPDFSAPTVRYLDESVVCDNYLMLHRGTQNPATTHSDLNQGMSLISPKREVLFFQGRHLAVANRVLPSLDRELVAFELDDEVLDAAFLVITADIIVVTKIGTIYRIPFKKFRLTPGSAGVSIPTDGTIVGKVIKPGKQGTPMKLDRATIRVQVSDLAWERLVVEVVITAVEQDGTVAIGSVVLDKRE